MLPRRIAQERLVFHFFPGGRYGAAGNLLLVVGVGIRPALIDGITTTIFQVVVFLQILRKVTRVLFGTQVVHMAAVTRTMLVFDHFERPIILFANQFTLNYFIEKHQDIKLVEALDVKQF